VGASGWAPRRILPFTAARPAFALPSPSPAAPIAVMRSILMAKLAFQRMQFRAAPAQNSVDATPEFRHAPYSYAVNEVSATSGRS